MKRQSTSCLFQIVHSDPLAIKDYDIIVVPTVKMLITGEKTLDGRVLKLGGPAVEDLVENPRHPVDYGNVLCTSAGGLPNFKAIYRAILPKSNRMDPLTEFQLRSCYLKSLIHAERSNHTSLVFPVIGLERIHVPRLKALVIAIHVIGLYFKLNRKTTLQKVCLAMPEKYAYELAISFLETSKPVDFCLDENADFSDNFVERFESKLSSTALTRARITKDLSVPSFVSQSFSAKFEEEIEHSFQSILLLIKKFATGQVPAPPTLRKNQATAIDPSLPEYEQLKRKHEQFVAASLAAQQNDPLVNGDPSAADEEQQMALDDMYDDDFDSADDLSPNTPKDEQQQKNKDKGTAEEWIDINELLPAATKCFCPFECYCEELEFIIEGYIPRHFESVKDMLSEVDNVFEYFTRLACVLFHKEVMAGYRPMCTGENFQKLFLTLQYATLHCKLDEFPPLSSCIELMHEWMHLLDNKLSTFGSSGEDLTLPEYIHEVFAIGRPRQVESHDSASNFGDDDQDSFCTDELLGNGSSSIHDDDADLADNAAGPSFVDSQSFFMTEETKPEALLFPSEQRDDDVKIEPDAVDELPNQRKSTSPEGNGKRSLKRKREPQVIEAGSEQYWSMIHEQVETPEICVYPGCNARFKKHSELRKHMFSHTGEYLCPHCSEMFMDSESYQSHIDLQHEGVLGLPPSPTIKTTDLSS